MMANTRAPPQDLARVTAAHDRRSNDARVDGAALSDNRGEDDTLTTLEAGVIDTADPTFRSTEQIRLAERLHQAAEKGDAVAIQALLAQGALVREDDPAGKSAIHLAAHDCHAGVIELLKTHGVSIDERDTAGKTQLFCEAESENVKVVQFLLENGANVDATNHENKTALFAAAENGHLEIVRLLVKNHANVDALDQQSRTPLFAAAGQGYLQIVQFLVDRGASVVAKQQLGRTPLMFAVSNGHLEVATYLLGLQDATSVTHTDKNKWTPLHVAVGNGHTQLVSLLISKYASIDARAIDAGGPGGATPLYLAAQRGNAEIAKFLIAKRASVNEKQDQGKTPLLAAAENGFVQIVKLLIRAGAWTEEKDNNGVTPLLAAASIGHTAIVQLLVDEGSFINVKDSQGSTSLMAAAKSGHFEIAKFLIEEGAIVDEKQRHGRTALMLAISHRHREVVKLLLDSGASLEVKDHAGWSPLHVAAGIKESEPTVILSMLIERGCRIDEKNLNGETPLDLGIKKGHRAAVERLLESRAHTVYNNLDYTALLICAGRHGHVSILRLLINRGASIHARDAKDGETILLSTARWGIPRYFKILAKQSASAITTLPDKRVSLLAGTLETMNMLCKGTRESQAMYGKIVERLTDICLKLQAHEVVNDRDTSFADIMYRFCRQLLRHQSRSTVERFIVNEANIGNLRDLHEEINSFIKTFGINCEDPIHSNWLQSWERDKNEQTQKLQVVVEGHNVLESELTGEHEKLDAVTHLQFLLKNLGKEESTEKSTTEGIIKRLNNIGTSERHIPEWFISRYNIEIEGWSSVGKSRFMRGQWMKSSVLVSKCDEKLELTQLEEAASKWHKLGHPNVLDLFGACHIGQTRFFVCDTVKEETLQGYLRNNRGSRTKLTKLHEAALGMLYLCNRAIVHGNLTTEKILVGDDGKTKISGFELDIVSESERRNKGDSPSTVDWLSPELQCGKTPSFESDVYALGVCILDILTMDDPWRVRFRPPLRYYLLASVTSPPPGITSNDHWSLVKEMCAPEPSRRASMQYVVTMLNSFKIRADIDKYCESPAAIRRRTSGSVDDSSKVCAALDVSIFFSFRQCNFEVITNTVWIPTFAEL